GEEKTKALKDYFQASDELRQKLEALKLPDPGDDLPPPSKWRLGIQISPDPEKLIVGSVVPESRAEKIGLKVGDVIDKIDDKPVKEDRKSTRLNSSHVAISYAVFCLKKN